jgi:hypothetical protein
LAHIVYLYSVIVTLVLISVITQDTSEALTGDKIMLST